MYKRNYNNEYKRDCERDTRVTIRLPKEIAKEFKNKLAQENKTMSQFLKDQVEKYINE